MTRPRTLPALKAATLSQCRKELGEDLTTLWQLDQKPLWETEAREEASKAVAKIDRVLKELEVSFQNSWDASQQDDGPQHDRADFDIPAYQAERILRAAVDRARAVLEVDGPGLAEYVSQFVKRGLTDREIAIRAMLQGYWPRMSKEPRELTAIDVIETVRKAVHGYRK